MIHDPPALLRRALRGAAALTCTALIAAGCTGGGEPVPEPGAPDQVAYVTGFGLFGRDAWIYCGIEQGFFEDGNIEVTVEPGAGTQGNLEALLGGNAQFTLIDMVGGLIAVSGAVGGWKAVAAIHQTDLSTWMTTDPELQTPRDLEGHTIAMPPGGVIPAIFPTYVELAGADPDKIRVEFAEGPEIPTLLATGQVDAIAQFAVGLPGVQYAVEDQEVIVHPLSDVITDLYGLGLTTTDELIADDPDLVARFREATLASLEWTLDHPDECAASFTTVDGVLQPEPVLAAEIRLMDPYVRVGDTFGTFDELRVGQMIATLEAAETIPAGITPQDVVALAFAAEEEDQ